MMAHIVSSLASIAGDHVGLAYALAFVLACAEAFPVLGAVVPGTAAIVALGALVPDGVLAFMPLIAATTAGAVAGDGLSYWLGRSYGESVTQIWPLRRNPALVAKSSAFFANHGGKAILIARYTPGVRALVPLAAGILGMPPLRFYAVNIMSAALWAPPHVTVGAAIGASVISVGAPAGWLIAVVFGIFVIVCLVILVMQRLMRRRATV